VPWFWLLGAVLALAAPRPAACDVWVGNGPDGGVIRALVLDPTDPDVVYAGTASGGVFKSTDAGATWGAHRTGLTNRSITALAVDPTTPSTVYAGTDGGGVFKSTDAGSTWSAANTGLRVSFVTALVHDPVTAGTVYAGTQVGLFKSTDGGGRWRATALDTWARALAIDPASPSTVYAGMDGGGVFKSTDGGRSYAAGEAAPYAAGWRESLRFWRALAARDWEQLVAVFAPDFVLEDHRPLGLLTSLSRDEYVASVRALLDLRPDATLRLTNVLAIGDRRSLAVGRWAGGEPEGTFEIPVVNAVEFGPDGTRRWHFYDLDQLDEAWSCYDPLRPDPLRRLA